MRTGVEVGGNIRENILITLHPNPHNMRMGKGEIIEKKYYVFSIISPSSILIL
jgi:hypothetical protein